VLCGQPAPTGSAANRQPPPIGNQPTPVGSPDASHLSGSSTLDQSAPPGSATSHLAPATSPDIAYVTFDYAEATRQLVEHLTANGYHQIALLGPVNTLVGSQFVAGCRDGLKRLGPNMESANQASGPSIDANQTPPSGGSSSRLNPAPETTPSDNAPTPSETLDHPLIATCASDITSAQLAALLLMNHPTKKPDALICLSDDIAFGAYQAARDLAIAIPQSLAIAGFGVAPYTNGLSPALTSVAAPYHGLGVAAANLALGLTTDSPITLPVEVILRESTMGPPRD
jgi:DNA-binding LacI/PurR family transcriptional regulator